MASITRFFQNKGWGDQPLFFFHGGTKHKILFFFTAKFFCFSNLGGDHDHCRSPPNPSLISTKFKMIKFILDDTIPKWLTFRSKVLVLNQKTNFKALEHNY